MPETTPQKQMEFQPRLEQIRDLIHRLALDTSHIIWSVHAQERMAERDITDYIAVDVLRTGSPQGPVEPGISPGEWKVKMVKEIKGQGKVAVVVLTIRNAQLFVKTTHHCS